MIKLLIGLLSVTLLAGAMARMAGRKVRARAGAQRGRFAAKRLRQDPRTGIYYPEG